MQAPPQPRSARSREQPGSTRRKVRQYACRSRPLERDEALHGYAGLNALVEIRPDIIKLDANLIRDIDADRVRQVVVGSAVQACRAMDIRVIAEGVETAEEARTVLAMGIELMQGFFFARPGIECLPPIRTAAGTRVRPE